MAGMLPKKPEDFTKIPGAKVAIIASMWHREIVEAMVASAKTQLLVGGVKEKDIEMYWAPGSHELPLCAKLLFEKHNNIDGVIAFGVVLRGGTTHNDSVLQATVNGFMDMTLMYSKPVINEVIGVENLEDAKGRAADKGIEAVFAFSETLALKRAIINVE